jgi:D-serine dehydratase
MTDKNTSLTEMKKTIKGQMRLKKAKKLCIKGSISRQEGL